MIESLIQFYEINLSNIKGVQKKRGFFFKNTLAFLKCFFYSLNLLGVKEKVLGIKPRKILTPVPGLKDS